MDPDRNNRSTSGHALNIGAIVAQASKPQMICRNTPSAYSVRHDRVQRLALGGKQTLAGARKMDGEATRDLRKPILNLGKPFSQKLASQALPLGALGAMPSFVRWPDRLPFSEGECLMDREVDGNPVSAPARYVSAAIAIRWASALVIISQIIVGLNFADMPKGPERMIYSPGIRLSA